MKHKIFSLILCLFMLASIPVIPASADFEVSYYSEDIYAGGILDMYAFVGESDLSGYTFQWQVDASLGEGHWYDLEDNAVYKGTNTNHLQLYSTYEGDYTDWDKIPFQCRITKNGITKTTPNIYMHIYPTENMMNALKNKGMGLYEPSLTNVTGLSSTDDLTYTASAYAGSNISILCGGSTESQLTMLKNSDVQLKREIKITENGKYIVTGENTSYIPYTIGTIKIELNMRIVMADADRGIYQTKTVYLRTAKPDTIATGTAKSACSLLRYTYNESEKLSSISKGTSVEIVGTEGNYYQVFFNNYVGYVPKSLLNVQTPVFDPVIKDIELLIAEPYAGQTPATTCQLLSEGCQLYKTDPITWTATETGKILKPGEKFQEGKSYTLSIWVAAKDGYRFQVDAGYNPKMTGTINGNLPPFIQKAYEQDPQEVVELTYTFSNIRAGALRGDLNGDGWVDNQDVEYLLWHTLFPTEYSLNQDGNLDGVSGVDNRDVEYLLWHTLFPETYPL